MNLNPGSIEDSRLSSESCWLLLCAYVGEGMLVSDGDPCVCRDWVLMQQRIHDHPDFDRWFLEYPEVRRTKNFYDLKFRHIKNKLLYSWPSFHHTVIFYVFSLHQFILEFSLTNLDVDDVVPLRIYFFNVFS